MSSIQKRPNGMWRARYRDPDGREHSRHFKYKNNPRKPGESAQHWLDKVSASISVGTYVDPAAARITVGEWIELWLEGYARNRDSTVRQARVHCRVITADLGTRRLRDVQNNEISIWVASLQERYAPSTVYAIYRRLSQLYAAAIENGLVHRSPVTRNSAPPMPRQRPYVATTEQVWALYDAMPAHFRPAVLLGAFAGLRAAEIVALRVSDVDFMRGIITPAIQYPAQPLKTELSRTPIPIPHELALELSRIPAEWGSSTLVVGAYGRPVTPTTLDVAFRTARGTVEGLPEGFRLHDLRHYFASLLIAAGLDIKTVQARLRHASAKTTLDTYGHLWPDRDESSRAAVSAAFATRADVDAAAQ